jgi:hypothetical protein
MKINMTQRPVGQGGFFNGELSAGTSSVRWIYDCGSNQLDALHREIDRVASGGEIDMLFISHLDSDHVCGLDLLLSKVSRVREVVLPYLNDEMILLALMARDASRGTLTGTFVDLCSDLPAWFGSRGVETITFVHGRDDEGEEEGVDPLLPTGPDGGEEGTILLQWTKEPSREAPAFADDGADQSASASGPTIRSVSFGGCVAVQAPPGVLNWAWIPYVHTPSKSKLAAFDAALGCAFGKPIAKRDIAGMAKSPAVREGLRQCYDVIWKNHNLISMTLYAGPVKEQAAGGEIRYCTRVNPIRTLGGWMLTGDADLSGERRCSHFLRFYRCFLPFIKVLMLPHHGARSNHSDSVLNDLRNLVVGYAASGPNTYGHPNRHVKRAVVFRGADFYRVGHARRAILEMAIR